MESFDIEHFTDFADIYHWLTGCAEYKEDIINLLVMSTNLSGAYCENILAENSFDFLKAYKLIIEKQANETLNN